MAHLAAGASLALAVEVDVQGRLRHQLAPSLDVSADEVVHHRAAPDQVRRPRGKPANRSDVLFELAGDRPFDRPVAAVEHARRDLIDQRSVRAGEELDGEDADMTEQFGDAQRRVASLRDLVGAGWAAWDTGAAKDPLVVLVLRRIPERMPSFFS